MIGAESFLMENPVTDANDFRLPAAVRPKAYRLSLDPDLDALTFKGEATIARRCFPCFDEPALKAVFEVALRVPKGRIAISNMPQVGEETLPNGDRRVRFAPSPVMSTYLLAFAVGEFDSIEGKTEKG